MPEIAFNATAVSINIAGGWVNQIRIIQAIESGMSHPLYQISGSYVCIT